MTDKHLSIDRILEMINNHDITSKDGYKLINEMRMSGRNTNEETAFFHGVWVKKQIDEELKHKTLQGNILLLDTSHTLHRLLRDNGYNTILVNIGEAYNQLSEDIYEINHKDYRDYENLFKALGARAWTPDHIIHFWSKDHKDTPSHLERGIYSLYNLTQVLSSQKAHQHVGVVYMYESHKNNFLPEYEAMSAFCKTAKMENPLLSYKYVNIINQQNMPKEGFVDILESELISIHDTEVMYQDAIRHVKEYYTIQDEQFNKHDMIRERGVYLIVGGMGGIGLILAHHMAKQYNARLILTGRTKYNDNISREIDKLHGYGAKAMYIQADISKENDTHQLVKLAIEQYGYINGVVHSAGLTEDAFIIHKKKDDIYKVLAPKVYGTMYLDQSLKDEPLDFFLLFSSITGVTGNMGQSDYAYANSFMDAYAHMREELVAEGNRSGKTLSINWPHWEDGGMTLDEKQKQLLLELTGLQSISNDEGLRILEKTLHGNVSQCIVSHGNTEKTIKFLNGQQPLKDKKTNHIKIDKEVLISKTEKMLMQICSDLFALPINKIDKEVDFEEYGIDSVMINQFNIQIEKKIGALPKTILFENRNIEDLTNCLTNHYESNLSSYFGEIIEQHEEIEVKPSLGKYMWKKIQPYDKQECNGYSNTIEDLSKQEDIAIIGLSGRYPYANDVNELWQNVMNQRDCVTEIPIERWDYRTYYDSDYQNVKEGKMYSKWGGFLEGASQFDPLFFNISPMEAEIMDPQERIFLQTVWETLEDAGYTRKQLREDINKEDSARVGVFVGITSHTYQLWGPEEFVKGNPVTPNSSLWSVANRVSYLFNFYGPSMPVDTACSSSLYAIHMACESIRRGECSTAVAGGVNLYLHPLKYVSMCQMRMLSPHGRCYAFGDEADGFVPGEGVGAVLLKPINQAIIDGDHIYGVVKATAVNHGGKTNGYTVPNPKAQTSLIENALAKGNINPRTISYIEAHGTGTKLGDPIEIAGLTKAFGNADTDKQYCSIGSIKSNIGHLESAAGIASLTKVLLMMKHQKLAPSIHAQSLNRNIKFESTPFYVQRIIADWKQPQIDNKTYPRRAGISSFGAGGANAHIIIEEYNQRDEEYIITTTSTLIILSAKNKDRLKLYANRMIEAIRSNGIELRDIAYTLQVGRENMEERIALVVDSKEELIDRLEKYREGLPIGEGMLSGNVKRIRSVTSNHKMVDIRHLTAQDMGRDSLREIASLWIEGQEIDWKYLYGSMKPKRVSLPTYPFKQDTYFIKKTKEAIKIDETIAHLSEDKVELDLQAEREDYINKMLYMPKWIETPKVENSTIEEYHNGRKILVIHHETSKKIVDKIAKNHALDDMNYLILGTQNIQHSSSVYEVQCDDIHSIDKYMGAVGTYDYIYFLGGIQQLAYDIFDTKELARIQESSILALYRLVRAMATRQLLDKPITFKVITNNIYKVIPAEKVLPFAGGLNGFVRNMVKEYPEVRASCIDLSLEGSEEDIACAMTMVLKEPASKQVEDIAIRYNRRYIKKLFQVELPCEYTTALVENGVYMIIGGLGSIGYDFAIYLARQVQGRIVIIGRSNLSEEGQSRINRIKDLGTQVEYIQADVTHEESMRQAVNYIKSTYGKINGVVHSAMVFTPTLFENITEDMLHKTLSPKVIGTVVLAKVLKDQEIDFLLFFSSGQAFTGNEERIHYATACNFEDDYAIALKDILSCKVSIINWGFWGSVKGEPVVDEYVKILERQGVRPINPEDGMEVIMRTLSNNIQQIATFNIKDFVLDLMGIVHTHKYVLHGERSPSLIGTLAGRETPELVPTNMDAFNLFHSFTQRALLDTFQRVGYFTYSSERYGRLELRSKLGIIDPYYRLYDAIIHILVHANYIEIEDDKVRTLPIVESQLLKNDIKNMDAKHQELIETYPELQAYMKLLLACTSRLPEILRGDVSATSVMFPNSSMELVEGIYKGNKNIDYFNNLVVEGVKAYIEAKLPYLKDGEKIKIIEVGAGTGGTSALVLDAIKEYGERLQYTYTDISMAFIHYGKREYGVHYPFMEFQVLNVEENPGQQGTGLGHYDIVIAANVLHATKNMHTTLCHIKTLLRDKGWLIVNEATRVQDFSTLTFGLTEGWWRYEDEENRLTGSPLLNYLTWEHILKLEGYCQVRYLGKSGIDDEMIQHVIIAESDGHMYVQDSITQVARVKEEILAHGEYENSVCENGCCVEDVLLELVADVLQMNREDVDPQIPFMDFGVDSIVGVKIVNMINEKLGVDMTPTDLFDYATVDKLSAHIEDTYPELIQDHQNHIDDQGSRTSEDTTIANHMPQVTYEVEDVSRDEEDDYVLNLFRKLEARTIDTNDVSDILEG